MKEKTRKKGKDENIMIQEVILYIQIIRNKPSTSFVNSRTKFLIVSNFSGKVTRKKYKDI